MSCSFYFRKWIKSRANPFGLSSLCSDELKIQNLNQSSLGIYFFKLDLEQWIQRDFLGVNIALCLLTCFLCLNFYDPSNTRRLGFTLRAVKRKGSCTYATPLPVRKRITLTDRLSWRSTVFIFCSPSLKFSWNQILCNTTENQRINVGVQSM